MTWPPPPGHPSLPHSPVFAQRKEEEGWGGVGIFTPSPSQQLIVLLRGWGRGLVSDPGSTHAEDLVGLIK